MYSIEFNNVWKKFQKGEKFHSLRDSIPNFAKKLFNREKTNGDLGEGEFWALEDVDFQVKKGEVLGIIGPNGAGKSTILKLLSRIIIPTEGTFNIKGRLSALIEVTAGFHPDFTGRENIYFNGSVLGMSKKEIDSKFDEIVEFSGVEEFIDTPIKRYSSGMSARLGFSVAAHVNPDVLLVDEVLAVGDMNFQAKCTKKMKELMESGVTIIFISHNIMLVQSLCKRLLLLNKGKIIKQGDPQEVIPFYENLVSEENVKNLKKKIGVANRKMIYKDEPKIQFSPVRMLDSKNGEVIDGHLLPDQNLTVALDYETLGPIEEPLFVVDIIRSDGVMCCSTNTKDECVNIKDIKGKGSISVEVGETRLVPGVYFIEVSVWDQAKIHPYAMSKKKIFNVDWGKKDAQASGVFFLKSKWSIGKK